MNKTKQRQERNREIVKLYNEKEEKRKYTLNEIAQIVFDMGYDIEDKGEPLSKQAITPIVIAWEKEELVRLTK